MGDCQLKKFLILFLCSCSTVLCFAVNNKPFVVPEITKWQGTEGSMQPSGCVLVSSASLKAVAQTFCQDYERLTGRKMTVVNRTKVNDGDIVFRLKKDKETGAEGYRMNIGKYCELTVPSQKAAYWAAQTLLQLSEQSASLPCGRALDVPQYRVRGFMLDVGRKFVPMDYLEKLVRVMAYYKMNTLQLHLNDNAFRGFFEDDWSKTPSAFRLECDTYPGLTAKDGSYSKQEYRHLVQLAEKCGVDIIPEIDAPAHALAFTQYNPDLASKNHGMDHLDIFNPEVYTFMDNLFKEYLSGKTPVFSGKYVHIGTDEYSNATQELKEQFRAYTDHYLALVQSYGKHPMLWGALSHADGKTPVRNKGVTMSLWSNRMSDPVEMKKQGWHFISVPDEQIYIVPLKGIYHDYLPIESLYKTWTPCILRNVKFEEKDPQIEGGMFALWNDHYGNGITVPDLHDRIYPALQVMADKCWTANLVQLPFEDFEKNKKLLSEAPGINEQGRMPSASLEKEKVEAEQPLGLPVEQVGFGHRISFTIDCRPEKKGTVLATGPYATFYLSDPVTGKLGYQREAYLDCFDYALPTEGEVDIVIETTNTTTTLYVNGWKKETLQEQRFYVVKEENLVDKMQETSKKPYVWNPSSSMRYQRPLFFPLQKAGNFNSSISHLKVEKM